MDKILHTPKTLPGVKRLDAQTRTITAPIEHPLTQCWVLANPGALACARFWSTERGIFRPWQRYTCARFCPLNRGPLGAVLLPSILNRSGHRENWSCCAWMWPRQNLCKILSINCRVVYDRRVLPTEIQSSARYAPGLDRSHICTCRRIEIVQAAKLHVHISRTLKHSVAPGVV